jgi:hypothetical protein
MRTHKLVDLCSWTPSVVYEFTWHSHKLQRAANCCIEMYWGAMDSTYLREQPFGPRKKTYSSKFGLERDHVRIGARQEGWQIQGWQHKPISAACGHLPCNSSSRGLQQVRQHNTITLEYNLYANFNREVWCKNLTAIFADMVIKQIWRTKEVDNIKIENKLKFGFLVLDQSKAEMWWWVWENSKKKLEACFPKTKPTINTCLRIVVSWKLELCCNYFVSAWHYHLWTWTIIIYFKLGNYCQICFLLNAYLYGL